MTVKLNSLWRDEGGLVLSAELIIIVTVCVLGLIVGLAHVQNALVTELQGISAAFSSLNQSFGFSGFHGCLKSWGRTSWTSGSFFVDTYTSCVGTAGVVCASAEICAASGVVTGGVITGPTEAPCVECVPEPLTGPCLDCPTGSPLPQGTAVPPAPRPEIPMGPVPQTLPQQ